MLPPSQWARAMTVHHILSPSDRTIITACEQAGCVKYRRGWDIVCDLATEEGRTYAELIRSGRHRRTFRELAQPAGATVVVFRFAPYQRCFGEHRTRPELFVVQNAAGMERDGARREPVPRFWAESLEESYERRRAAKQRG
jgi:hypothetical protein